MFILDIGDFNKYIYIEHMQMQKKKLILTDKYKTA